MDKNHSFGQSKNGCSGWSNWPKSLKSAHHLFRLRQIQSQWYTALFQSGTEPWQDPYQRVWTYCRTLTEWYQDISFSASPKLQTLFELELLYSYIYILSPSPRAPMITNTARDLLIDLISKYSNVMLSNVVHQRNKNNSACAPLDYNDIYRVYQIGSLLLDLTTQGAISLVHTNVQSAATETPPAGTVMPLADSVSDSVRLGEGASNSEANRITESVYNFQFVLSALGERFGFVSWHERFEKDSAAVLTEISTRSQLPDTAA